MILIMGKATIFHNNRYAMIYNKLWIENQKSLSIILGGYFGACIIFGILFGISGSIPNVTNFGVYIFLSGLAISLATARLFTEFTSKEGKISMLMLPASASSKFLTRFIALIVCSAIFCVAGYFVFQLSDMISFQMRFDGWPAFYNPFEDWTYYKTQALFLLIALFMFTESIFIYGAVVYPKKSFLKTIGVLALIGICLVLLITWTIKAFVSNEIYLEVTDENAFTWSVIAITALISIAITWGAYYKFKHKYIA